MATQTKVLIVGGGFGGVKAALELAGDDSFKVTLLTDQHTLRYYPSLYHTATGGRQANSAIELSKLLGDTSVNVIYGRAVTVDRKAKTVGTEAGEAVPYDRLILALGVVTNYFGIEGLQEYSYGIKSIEEVQRFKAHLHKQLIDNHEPDLNYVIVGAGPTGIELAGALPGYLRHIMNKHGIAHRAIHVDLIESAPRLLPRMPKDTSRLVRRRLRHLGVKLYLKQAVQAETADELIINGKPIRSHTVIWTAGVTNHPFFKANNFVLTDRGKVSVNAYLQTEDNIYVIGDNANTPFSGMAQTALHDGEFVAKNLRREAYKQKLLSYEVKQPVSVIPVGEHWAAVTWGGLRIYGWLGWVLRELGDLNGFRNYQSLPKALAQWTSEFGSEETCAICDPDIGLITQKPAKLI